ncbi:sugar transferase [Campylobacter iguaniorum]|nr:sugar transferase [Campylobacter iguaniorum]
MIILGRKYKFTDSELKQLNKKFHHVNIVRYRNRDEQEVLNELENIAKTEPIDILVLNTKVTVGNEIIKYITKLQFAKQHKRLKIITMENLMEKYLFKCYIPEDNADLRFLSHIKAFGKFEYITKRIIDYIGSIVLFLVTFPIIIYARNKIKSESPGTSMFKQLRVGKDNIEFQCIKFRSMRLDAEANGAKFASKDDDRTFHWGNTMRKTRIDELPQIINVMKGEMHLIGPRPERKIWTDQFEQDIPYYNERHLVRPGITGWAQVMYPYGANAEDAKQKLMYDLYYIKHWSLWLELKVIYKTMLVVIGRKGV